MTHRRNLSRDTCDRNTLHGIRLWIRANLPPGFDSADAELVCTELVTNAIEHGGGARSVRITVDAQQVYVEVDDVNADALPTLGPSRLGRYRGRGIALVDAFATWGTVRTVTGKTVWACITLVRRSPRPCTP